MLVILFFCIIKVTNMCLNRFNKSLRFDLDVSVLLYFIDFEELSVVPTNFILKQVRILQNIEYTS